MQSRAQARVPECPFQPGACHAGGRVLGLRAGRPEPVEDELEPVEEEMESWLRLPAARRRGRARPGAPVEGSWRAGRRPLSGLRLLPDPSPGPAASEAFLEGFWGEYPSPPHLPHFGRRSSVAFVEAEARVWPQGRAGQGRKMSALLAEAAFLGPLKGTWRRVKQIRGMWPALRGSWIPGRIAL